MLFVFLSGERIAVRTVDVIYNNNNLKNYMYLRMV